MHTHKPQYKNTNNGDWIRENAQDYAKYAHTYTVVLKK